VRATCHLPATAEDPPSCRTFLRRSWIPASGSAITCFRVHACADCRAARARLTERKRSEILHGDPETVENELVYIIETDDGRIELLRHSEFEQKVEELQQAAGTDD
jgi:hypothetical protein